MKPSVLCKWLMFRGSILPDTISAPDDSGQIISWCVRSCICCPLSWWWSYFRIQMDNFMWLHFADGIQNIFTITKHFFTTINTILTYHLHTILHNIYKNYKYLNTMYTVLPDCSLLMAGQTRNQRIFTIVRWTFTLQPLDILYSIFYVLHFYNRNSACTVYSSQ